MIVELKDDDSQETLLRAICEARTYMLKIRESQGEPPAGKAAAAQRFEACYGPGLWYGVALLTDGRSRAYRDFLALGEGRMENLRRLAQRWDVVFYGLSRTDQGGDGAPFGDRRYAAVRLAL